MKNLEDRFWNKVNKASGRYGIDGKFPTECWEWIAYTENGYGRIRDGRKQYFAHRISMKIHVGDFSDHLCVLHKCDNRLCIRPDHLFLGTRADNGLDMKLKKRSKGMRGTKHPMAKITEDDVKEIRRLAAIGIIHSEIARIFNICRPNVGHILSGRIWKHVQ